NTRCLSDWSSDVCSSDLNSTNRTPDLCFGEPWQVTKHKSGVRLVEFSPDGKTLLLVATVPETEDQEKRTKNKDDAEVVDHDLKMAQLWTWDIAAGLEKQIIKGDFTVRDPRWSPDGLHITFTSN